MTQIDPLGHSIADPDRLAALDALAVLGTPTEQSFDDVARLASRLCAAPVALVSLVAADRQWFKANVGFPRCETGLEGSVCKFALTEPDLLVIPDLAADPRTASNPLVTGEPHIRFYAGAPLRLTDGAVVGSLCVIDTVSRPKGLTPQQGDDLRALGRQVVLLLEARRSMARDRAEAVEKREAQASALARAAVSEAQNIFLRVSDQRSRFAQEAGGVGTFELIVASSMMQVSAEFCRLYGVPIAPLYSAATFEALVLPEDANVRSRDASREDGSAALDVEYRIHRADDGELRWIARRASFTRDEHGTVVGMFGTVRDVTERRKVQDALHASEALARESVQRVQLALAAGAIIGTWNWDIPSDRFTIDEAFAQTFGLDPALGRKGIPLAQIVATVHPDDKRGLSTAITTAILRGGAYAHQYRVRRADGRYYWIEANGRVDRAEDGTPLSFPGVLLDIEERRAAQAALTASESRLRALVTAGAQSVYRMSPDWQEMRQLDGHGFLADTVVPTVHWLDLYIDPADRPEMMAAIEDAIRRKGTFELEHRVRRADGSFGWTLSRAVPLFEEHGEIAEWFGAASDVTARRTAEARQAALVEIGDQLRDLGTVPTIVHAAAGTVARMLGATRAGYGLVDVARETVEVPSDWCAPGIASVAGLHDFRDYGSYIEDLRRGAAVLIKDVERDPRTQKSAVKLLAIGVRTLINVPVMERGRLVGIGFINSDRPNALSAEELAFVRAVADRIQVAVARVQAEAQQVLLNGELSHRLKNTLSMVQGIASQTLRSVPDQAPVQAFTQRLVALSQAHDVLLQDSWTSAPMRAVVDRVLAVQAPLERFRINGPNLSLAPQATLSLSMLLHELTTNAVKYGALSTEAGMVSVTWRVEDDDDRTAVLTWQERGGPPAQAPTRRGFGTRLIQLGLVGTRDTRLSYSTLGFDAEFRAPSSEVVAS
ncbi:PAS domain S-box-containing protein [Methylobacterium sp. ap11]|uniref:PAS domain-containing protein n=1 Tax=Methylobacterium sp. ap11 TaxID=1761799 RepID=UPI0008C9915D|nr:PAS domain-containing protein [Methylobacterium sp. ap11]SEO68306.1 PAS domain S-box-containing protein [Methylobacterium sp. ap11]